MTAIPEDMKDVLDSTALAYVATVAPNGWPRNSPMWFEWDGAHVLLSHTKARAKYRDVQADPRVAVSIVDPGNPGRYLEIRGGVEVEDDPDKTLIHRLARKYEGADRYEGDGPGDERVIFRVTPERVVPRRG